MRRSQPYKRVVQGILVVRDFICSNFILFAATFFFNLQQPRANYYSSLERVDSRVQHIWRLRVMGSWQQLYFI